jgi:asparaginyl-tRNA synthetase
MVVQTQNHKWTQQNRYLTVIQDPWYRQLVELQNLVTVSSFQHWYDAGITALHLPITTGSISSPMGLGSDSQPVAVDLCGVRTYLADSMQFYLEYGCRLVEKGCHYLLPSFRGEAADSTHLCQFYHAEAEIRGGRDEAMQSVERYLRYLATKICEHQPLFGEGRLDHVRAFAERTDRVPRISFEDASQLLADEPGCITRSPDGAWRTMTRVGERKLIERYGGCVWLTDHDHLSVPFYQAYADAERRTARNADLLMGIGEVVGLGERHATGSLVRDALRQHQVDPNAYEWYIAMKDSKPMTTSGFGVGIERFLLWVLLHDEIRDVQLIPRFNGERHFM